VTQPPDNDLKALWQGQPTEIKLMSATAIRARAARYTTRVRWGYGLGLALMLAEMLIFGRYALIAPNMYARAGLLVILVGLGWMLARFTLGWPRKFPAARASGETILEFHRSELQRQSVTFANMMVTVGPVLLGAIIFAAAGALTHPNPNRVAWALPIGLMVLCLVAAWWLTRRQEQKRLRQIAEIDATRPE
jgi:hypothetical protein